MKREPVTEARLEAALIQSAARSANRYDQVGVIAAELSRNALAKANELKAFREALVAKHG